MKQKPRGVLQKLMRSHRLTVMIVAIIAAVGWSSLQGLPKEANPDVIRPAIRVNVTQPGISPSDAEILITKPIENEISGVAGIDKIRSWSFEGSVWIKMDFDIDTDMVQAMTDVKDAVDRAEGDLPEDATEPRVLEDNPSLDPIMTVSISGNLQAMPKQSLIDQAKELEDQVKKVTGVLDTELIGDATDIVDVALHVNELAALNISPVDIQAALNANNLMVRNGTLDDAGQRLRVKVPGLLGSLEEIRSIPVTSLDGDVKLLGELATITLGHADLESTARVDGRYSLALNVIKSRGYSTVEVANTVKAMIETSSIADGIEIRYLQDQSVDILSMLQNLSTNVMSSEVIVTFVLGLFMSTAGALLVGSTIPISYLIAFGVLYVAGMTLNSFVLFGLILVTGMLVDAAIVVSEQAEKMRQWGHSRKRAYVDAASRLAPPVIASTLTTIMAFLPLLFWPGITGKFMRYLPLTVILTLIASLIASIIIMPGLAALIPSWRRFRTTRKLVIKRRQELAKHKQDHEPRQRHGRLAWYYSALLACMKRPVLVMGVTLGLVLSIVGAYSQWNKGVEFFPPQPVDFVEVRIYKEGNLTVDNMVALTAQVEDKLKTLPYVTLVNSSIQKSSFSDRIARIKLELADWDERPTIETMTQEIDGRLADTTNLTYDMRWPNSGPRTTGKAISLMMYGKDPVALNQAVDATMARISAPEVGAINVSTERRVPGKEMSFIPNRHLIALSDTSLTEIGAAINIASGGYKLGDVSLPGYDEELEVIAREPEEDRSKTFLNSLRVATGSGPLRLDSVGYWRTQDGVAVIYRENGRRALEIEADIGPKKQLSGVSAAIEAVMVDIVKEYPSVTYRLGGEAEDNAETQAFMVKALAMAVALMMAVLLYQLNSFKQTFIVMLAVVFSVLGVLLTLLILRAPFGSVFSGLAILSLAGISINQNIVLIDDFNERLSHGGS